MKQFNYKKAWQEFAMPAYNGLPIAVKDLLHEVIAEEPPGDRYQNANLDAIWPDTDLRDRFESIRMDILAQAAYIIYCYGHWGYENNGVWAQKNGGYWRFASYVDQILRARYKIPCDSYDTRSLSIVEGCLRYCHSTEDSWTWTVLGYVTKDLVDRARKYLIESEEAHLDLFVKAEESYPKPKWNVLPEGSFMEEES